jgi:D-proline reductase (dithiol) PrdB
MGANAGAPNDPVMQTAILKETLEWLTKIESAGKVVPLNHEYVAHV